MNNTLWVFGDSFSNLFRLTRPDYYELKNRNVKTYGEILSDILGFKLELYAPGGFSNESIFFSFINKMDNIKKNDIVIINWTEINRFRLLNDKNHFIEFNAHHVEEYEDGELELISKKTLQEILYHRSVRNYTLVLCDYIKIINKLMYENQIIHWSWFNFNEKIPLTVQYMNLETINDETNGLINDLHYSEKSHIILSEVFNKLIKK